MDFSFLNHEALKNMNPKKVQILKELAAQTEGKADKEIAPLLLETMKKMQKENLTFTKEESGIMMDILTRNMSPAERAKVDMMKKMMMSKFKTRRTDTF